MSHGCTGKGNDQVRFEVGIGALAPDLKVHRAGPGLRAGPGTRRSRYAEEQGPADRRDRRKSPYSIDQNLWGRAVETGFLEDIWNAPIEDVYSYTADPAVAARRRTRSSITLRRTASRSRSTASRSRRCRRSSELNRRAGAQGVGRLDMVEDRLVGIKSREVYEAPGAIALITAHQELENVTVERDLARFKRGVDQRWGELVYDGLWFSPLKRGAGRVHRRRPSSTSPARCG